MQVDDASGLARRAGWFDVNGASPTFGLALNRNWRILPSTVILRMEEFTWTVDSIGRPCLSSVLTTLDPGTGNQKQSKIQQVVNSYGNLVSQDVFSYTSLTSPVRSYAFGYLNSPDYVNRFLRNRATEVTVNGLPLVTNAYDGYPLTNRT